MSMTLKTTFAMHDTTTMPKKSAEQSIYLIWAVTILFNSDIAYIAVHRSYWHMDTNLMQDLDDRGTTEISSREDTLPAENSLPAEKHISESAGDTSEPQSVEIVWPAFDRPCRVYSWVLPCESDPTVRRILCERIRVTIGGGGGHRQQQRQHGQSSDPATTSRPTKVFSLHKQCHCDCSEYFSTTLSPRNRDVFVEAQTDHFVFNANNDDGDDDDDVDEPDDFYFWAVWLDVCSGCKHEFKDDHRYRPSRPESGRASSGSSESAAGAGEYLYAIHKPYGLPQPPLCKSLSNRIAGEEEGEGDHTRYGDLEDERKHRNCYGKGGNLSSS
ncbi:hypothetical protein B0T13DRAFT_501490 [Neurospora crassa]|nr:hypothetical protein B0T13DRAFT_501490 [Neurospora crassa]